MPMQYINTNFLNSLCVELTNWCNASCPMCSRFDLNGQLRVDRVNSHHTPLSLFKNQVGPDILSKLKVFWSCGTYGDAIMNPECIEIFQYVRECNPTAYLNIHSNGGARNSEFWANLAKLDVVVTFGIDGLEDTNHLYRRGVQWQRLLKNVKTFIDNGGCARWRFLVFEHNKHQIREAYSLARSLGFMGFEAFESTRFGSMYSSNIQSPANFTIPHSAKFHNILKRQALMDWPFVQPEATANELNSITCRVNSFGRSEVYIRADGTVQPCCMLGDLDIDEANRLVTNMPNLHHNTLTEILEGDFFTRIGAGIADPLSPYRLKTCVSTCGGQQRYTQHIRLVQ